MNNKIILGSLALDLQRVATGYHGGSPRMAERFYKEVLMRIHELDSRSVKPYLRKHLRSIIELEKQPNIQKKAEDALMYSTIVQNYCLTYE